MSMKKFLYKKIAQEEMLNRVTAHYDAMLSRRSIREFSNKPISIEIITQAIKVACGAPSGANKQPWTFIVVKDEKLKKKIRQSAEKEEKEFYAHRASQEWLDDLNQFNTDWQKPFLEKAPYLIVVFKQVFEDGEKRKKNYYVNESVGIATGFLLTALHYAGLATLTHTPSPMGFLEKILKRPKNEKAYVLIPVGCPAENAMIPNLKKKSYSETIVIK
ncbi:MAG: nitroreductase family protein [Candidatus Marinimicrobia bacterium]|nr:nitroreductase family protein [Candidatus Neomarinimicrobiota bacterium]